MQYSKRCVIVLFHWFHIRVLEKNYHILSVEYVINRMAFLKDLLLAIE